MRNLFQGNALTSVSLNEAVNYSKDKKENRTKEDRQNV